MKNINDQHEVYKLFVSYFGNIDPDYDPSKDKLPKYIFKRQDFSPISDYLFNLKNDLLKDFLSQNENLHSVVNNVGRNVMQKRSERTLYKLDTPDKNNDRFPIGSELLVQPYHKTSVNELKPEGWKNVEIRYYDSNKNIKWDMNKEYAERKYPTAYNLVQEFDDDCIVCSYSYLASNTVIHRHGGEENKEGKYVRIHIPLIIPKGDIFIEVNGTEIKWDDIFAFDNQFVHSAYNLTNEDRLIFMIDISRKRLGLPDGEKWNKNRFLYSISKPFVRKI